MLPSWRRPSLLDDGGNTAGRRERLSRDQSMSHAAIAAAWDFGLCPAHFILGGN